MSAPTTTSADRTVTPGFGQTLRSEWVKLTSVRSTWWTVVAIFVIGGGLTTLMGWANADWLASAEADESVGSFVTWGMMIAPVAAVSLGALAVTSEYGSGMIRSTFAATPARGAVLAAKALVVAGVLLVVGTLAALVGYVGSNHFFAAEGIGLPLEGDVARAIYGSGLYLAGIGVMTVAVGFLVRHTAGAISLMLAVLLVLGNMAMLVPGAFGDWLVKLMPGNAGSPVSTVVSFNPDLLDAWPGFGVFVAETALLVAAAWLLLRRRDA